MIERDTLICSPWEQRAVPSVERACARCGAGVAVSNVALKAHPGARYLCLVCAQAEVGDELAGLSPEVRREVTARTGRDPGKLAGVKVKDITRGRL